MKYIIFLVTMRMEMHTGGIIHYSHKTIRNLLV